jgi:hypothetical protein
MKLWRVLCIGLLATGPWVFSSQAPSQDRATSPTFLGTVLDKTDASGIPRAHIWIHEDSGRASFSLQPGRSGNFSINLPDGYYDVLFSASGYAPFCKKIWIRSGKLVKVQATLGIDRGTTVFD